MENTQLQKIETNHPETVTGGAISVSDILSQQRLIQDTMKTAMRKGEDYGVIPGCGDKPTLLLPGAQKLNMLFQFVPSYIVSKNDLPNGHVEYEVRCQLKTIRGVDLGEGVGSCSTMESKYRFRSEVVDIPIPEEYWKTKNRELLGGQQFVAKKMSGVWKVVKQCEVDNPHDARNTVLKMAKKRALVDAILTRTAAGSVFTQDLEDQDPQDIGDGNAQSRQSTPTQQSPKPQQPKAGDVETKGVRIAEVVEKTGEKNGKAWKIFIVKFEGGFEASTFSTEIGDRAKQMQGEIVDVMTRPGRREGTFELTAVMDASL